MMKMEMVDDDRRLEGEWNWRGGLSVVAERGGWLVTTTNILWQRVHLQILKIESIVPGSVMLITFYLGYP